MLFIVPIELGTSFSVQSLTRRETTSDYIRGLAQTIQTKLSQLPSIVEIADPATGSHYHINLYVLVLTMSLSSMMASLSDG